MESTDWLACEDPAPMIRELSPKRHMLEMRRFAVGCARRVWLLLADEVRVAVAMCEHFLAGAVDEAELRGVVKSATESSLRAFPAGARPCPAELATSAAILAASPWQHSPENVLLASAFAAAAVARAEESAAAATDARVYSAAWRAEMAGQADLLRQLIPHPLGTSRT